MRLDRALEALEEGEAERLVAQIVIVDHLGGTQRDQGRVVVGGVTPRVERQGALEHRHGVVGGPCEVEELVLTVGIGDQRRAIGTRRADAVVIASPVYWFTVSAQAKLFIDRGFYPLGGPEGHALTGREFGFILTYADSDPFTSGAVNALHTFQDIARYIEARVVGTVYGSATEAGEIREQQDVMGRAYELGKRLGEGA